MHAASVAALAAFALVGEADTTLTVRPGTSLCAVNYAGEIAVRAWNQDRLRIESSNANHALAKVFREENTIFVKVVGKKPSPGSADLTIHVPVWMAVEVGGVHTDVTVEGTRAPLEVETVHGDVTVEDARGRISLRSVLQDVQVVEAGGSLSIEAVNGDIVLDRVDADTVRASTVNGEIRFDGEIRERGVYEFGSHNGDIKLVIPRNAGAEVNVSMFGGSFEAGFPVSVTEEKRGRRYSFTLGSGSARVEIETFQGSIELRHREREEAPTQKEKSRGRQR